MAKFSAHKTGLKGKGYGASLKKGKKSAHKPLSLLKKFRDKMAKNIVKLDKLIKARS